MDTGILAPEASDGPEMCILTQACFAVGCTHASGNHGGGCYSLTALRFKAGGTLASIPGRCRCHLPSSSGKKCIPTADDPRSKDFYWCLWPGDNETHPSIGVRETFCSFEVAATTKDVGATQ